jgi:8-oxo-dGTP pyrophosphatase MutT (NUDIX family)
MRTDIIALSDIDITTRLAHSSSNAINVRGYSTRFPKRMFSDSPRSAAVLVPLLRKDRTWQVLFTRRTSSLPEHSGQVAFPGGRSDPDDLSPEFTALRETHEEIGLSPDDVNVLGNLRELRTISNYCVNPVVGRIPWPYDFVIAREEVSRVFTIPLEWLADLQNHQIKNRELPAPYPAVPVIYFDHYDGELLWGISAEITMNLLKSLGLI